MTLFASARFRSTHSLISPLEDLHNALGVNKYTSIRVRPARVVMHSLCFLFIRICSARYAPARLRQSSCRYALASFSFIRICTARYALDKFRSVKSITLWFPNGRTKLTFSVEHDQYAHAQGHRERLLKRNRSENRDELAVSSGKRVLWFSVRKCRSTDR